ncbi:MAG: homogentisate 1,2-dioxygenase, partial [Myxococcota bacterium]
LMFLTEMGTLMVRPGEVVLIPRGLRFSVFLLDGAARGYVGETFGYGFELPERGPVGANGMTEARHFRIPEPWFEDRLRRAYRITAKLGGELYDAHQDYSPYDVVAWHGNYTPYVYDLANYSPVTAGRFDHPDPSIYSVLSAPLDERGGHALDLVYFPPRWDVSEDTFRPPFFHRNATTEINGIIMDPDGDEPPFYAGGLFITPSMTPHGVRHRAVEKVFMSRGQHDEPSRTSDDSMWFQFESALPISLTPWAKASPTRMADWHDQWGAYRSFFDPNDEV